MAMKSSVIKVSTPWLTYHTDAMRNLAAQRPVSAMRHLQVLQWPCPGVDPFDSVVALEIKPGSDRWKQWHHTTRPLGLCLVCVCVCVCVCVTSPNMHPPDRYHEGVEAVVDIMMTPFFGCGGQNKSLKCIKPVFYRLKSTRKLHTYSVRMRRIQPGVSFHRFLKFQQFSHFSDESSWHLKGMSQASDFWSGRKSIRTDIPECSVHQWGTQRPWGDRQMVSARQYCRVLWPELCSPMYQSTTATISDVNAISQLVISHWHNIKGYH